MRKIAVRTEIALRDVEDADDDDVFYHDLLEDAIARASAIALNEGLVLYPRGEAVLYDPPWLGEPLVMITSFLAEVPVP